MKPVTKVADVFAFSIESGLHPNPDPVRLAKALRLAVMSRTRDVLSTSRLPSYFSGHPDDGSPIRSEEPHLAFVFAPLERQLLVVTPGHIDKRNSRLDMKHLTTLELALQELRELRAGVDGCLKLRRIGIDVACHRLFQVSHVWESLTPYNVNRHAKKSTAETVLLNDVLNDCEQRGFTAPQSHGFGMECRIRHGSSGPAPIGIQGCDPRFANLGKIEAYRRRPVHSSGASYRQASRVFSFGVTVEQIWSPSSSR